MRKISYPFTTNIEKKLFLNKYYDTIYPKIPDYAKICKKISEIDSTWNLKKLLTADFTDLVEFSKKDNVDELNKFFKKGIKKNDYLYTDLQRQVADFFNDTTSDKESTNIKSCFYCNIEYINGFNEEYSTVEEFINFAHWKDIKNIVGKTIADKISKQRKILTISENDAKKLMSKETFDLLIKNNKTKNEHFTLDHVLPKSKYTYLSISLFNLIPCCYSCNSKFKLEKNFKPNSDLAKIIPSSTEFQLDKLFEFQLKFNNTTKEVKVDLVDKLSIENVAEFITMFKLQNRYNFHVNKAEEMIKKRKVYSDSQIKEIARLLKRDEQFIKEDLFGKECFESNNEPFEKYKQDIAKQLGLI